MKRIAGVLLVLMLGLSAPAFSCDTVSKQWLAENAEGIEEAKSFTTTDLQDVIEKEINVNLAKLGKDPIVADELYVVKVKGKEAAIFWSEKGCAIEWTYLKGPRDAIAEFLSKSERYAPVVKFLRETDV